jgi:hypothetical protein
VIYCPQCRKVMEYQHTLAPSIPGGNCQSVLYTCTPCRVRCVIETKFYFDADFERATGLAEVVPHACYRR